MNLAQVKSKLEIPQLDLNTAKNLAGESTEWMRHWDNDRRIAVSIHKDLVAELKADKNIASLALQHEIRKGDQGDYQSYRIVKYAPAEETL